MSELDRCISCGQPIEPDDEWVWGVWKRGEKQHTDPSQCIDALVSRIAHIEQVTNEEANQSKEHLAEIREPEAKATVGRRVVSWSQLLENSRAHFNPWRDAKFIAVARTAVPELLAENARLWEALGALVEAVPAITQSTPFVLGAGAMSAPMELHGRAALFGCCGRNIADGHWGDCNLIAAKEALAEAKAALQPSAPQDAQ